MCRKRGTSSGRWITRERRLGIYLRDGLCCVYCGRGIEDGVKLTLDHLIVKSKRAVHKSWNPVTACLSCNSKRQHKNWKAFTWMFFPERAEEVIALVLRLKRRRPKVAEAKLLIGSRTFTEVMSTIGVGA